MKNLSISLSKDLINDSDDVAKELGVSRTEFIRRAVIHELKNFKIKNIENNMIKSFEAMKKSKDYLIESEELDVGFGCDLKNKDVGEWWKK
jgi:metal-responsive CopG/Arc/MetJ family transcriptional regulator